MFGHAEHHFQAHQKNIDILDLAAGMHMKAIYMEPGCFYDPFNMPHLVNGNSKFTIHVACRDLKIATSHDMWIEAYANGVTVSKLISKLF